MKTKSILSLALCAALSVSFAANAQGDAGSGSPTIENSFTFTPAPGAIDYDTMQRGFSYLSISPKSGVTPAVNADCTEKVIFTCNGETLAEIEPKDNLVFTYVDFHGGFWSGSLQLNRENTIPAEKLQQAGTYEIKFPANLIQVNEVNTPACTLTYTYAAPVEGTVDFKSALANADGDNFYSIYVRMDNENLAVSVTDDFKCEMYYNGELSQTFTNVEASAYGSSFSINFPTEVSQNAQPGEYTFKVFPNSLKAVDKANNIYGFNTEELSYVYTLLEGPAVVKMDPENGAAVKELSEVTITFNRLMGLTTPWDSTIKLQVMQGEEVLDDYEVEIETVDGDFEGYDVLITIDPAITTDGEYSIANISSFLNFKLHAEDQWPSYWSTPIECSFKVDSNVGIENVSTDNGPVTVYNIQGVCILKDATREALNNLPAGLYIINGRKVLK